VFKILSFLLIESQINLAIAPTIVIFKNVIQTEGATMTPTQIARTQELLSSQQFHLFSQLSKIRGWMGELYLELVLSAEEVEYIYRSETNICNYQDEGNELRTPYLMR
jgi:hypothetical protein